MSAGEEREQDLRDDFVLADDDLGKFARELDATFEELIQQLLIRDGGRGEGRFHGGEEGEVTSVLRS